MEEHDRNIWKLIESYMKDNPQYLVRHHIESYNDFFQNGIYQMFREKNPMSLKTDFDDKSKVYRHQCNFYFGGKSGKRIYFGKPTINDGGNNTHYMYPNEARLRDMNYFMTIHYDIEVEYLYYEGETEMGARDEDEVEVIEEEQYGGQELEEEKRGGKRENTREAKRSLLERGTKKLAATVGGKPKMRAEWEEIKMVFLGKMPIMVQSEFCILNKMPKELLFSLGECRNEQGGYFIINGKEKVIITQEKFADNIMYIRESSDDHYTHSADIRSVSENVSKPIRTLSVKIMRPTREFTFENIVVLIPNITRPVPLFIVFRALGVLSDKEIIQYCVLDLNKYADLIDLFVPSVHDAGTVYTQSAALFFISQLLIKNKTIEKTMEILSDYFLPHVGEMNFKEKAHYLGYMVFRLLSVKMQIEPPTNRDNFKYKRMETAGSLISQLFREYYNIQINKIHHLFEEQYYAYSKGIYGQNLKKLVNDRSEAIFNENRVLEKGFSKAFRGDWGSQTHTKRIGVVQDLNRLSFNSAMSHLRKTNVPLDASVKLVGPRLLHNTQWGYLDPIDTPDGGHIGIHKNLSLFTNITKGISREPMIQWLRTKTDMKMLSDCSIDTISVLSKVIVNGHWVGVIHNPIETVAKIKLFRRNALVPIYISATFDVKQDTVYIYTDAGRLTRPIFYVENGALSFDKLEWDGNAIHWENLISGIHPKKNDYHSNTTRFFDLEDLYVLSANEENRNEFIQKNMAIVDYLDTSETENALICINHDTWEKNKGAKQYTHCEIHESLVYGPMFQLIIFPEHNPQQRDLFSCGQSKQAVSLYHSNFQNRMDKNGVVLNTSQIPIVKSRYLQYITGEENLYGQNTIVAIMSHTGYNVEDSILFNEGSLNRGLFRTTYFNTYHSEEEKSKVSDHLVEKTFTNVLNDGRVIKNKPGYDYSYLDDNGIIKEGTAVNDKIIMIGLTTNDLNSENRIDESVPCKKGQLGVVDKTFVTEGEEGHRVAKVRIREERIPTLGDKMACALPTQQVLTQYGWIQIKDINIDVHRVCTLDKEGHLFYEHPVAKYEYHHEGEMYKLLTPNVDIVCTMNHKLYVSKNEESFTLVEAEKTIGKTVGFRHSLENVSPDVKWMQFEDGRRHEMDDWLIIVGMILINGSVHSIQHFSSVQLDIIRKMNVDFTYNKNTGNIEISKHYSEFFDFETQFPEYIWKLSQQQCRVLLDIVMNTKGVETRWLPSLSRLAVHCGYSTCIDASGDEFIFIVKKEGYSLIKKNHKNETVFQYKGMVYCIEMPSSHLYYMRESDLSPSVLIGNSRSGQKGTVGLVLPERDMPFTKDGVRPDLIINPHAIPTRMTIGQLLEMLLAKGAVSYGAFGDCTAFNNQDINKVKSYGEHLNKMGFHSTGNEIMYNGMTGEQIETEIFIGPTYYMRLKHMVKDKINYRALGPNAALTRQPVSGRANDGGLRIGEMERDSMVGHGISNFLKESMMERADKYFMAVCNKTGMLAIYNPSKNLFMSPMADGPIAFHGANGDLRLEKITKFGREFSIVSIPYSMKLFMQELQAMNIQMRLITEDNIQQIENLSLNSNTLGKILGDDKSSLEQLIHKIVKNKPIVGGGGNETLTVSPVLDPIKEEPEEPEEPKEPIVEEPKEPDEEKESEGRNKTPEKGVLFADEVEPIEEIVKEAAATTTIGGGKTAEFKEGEYVYLRGDGNRQWRIKNVGERFLTVETEETDDLSEKERVKVVSFLDAIHLRDGTQSHFQESQQMQLQHPLMMQPPMMYPQQQQPPIINIKLVGGSDHSTTRGGFADAGQESTIVSGLSPSQPQKQGLEKESSGVKPTFHKDFVDFSKLSEFVVSKER